ncbi:Rho guanine nucleotide exchange factor [Mactra antiquata]
MQKEEDKDAIQTFLGGSRTTWLFVTVIVLTFRLANVDPSFGIIGLFQSYIPVLNQTPDPFSLCVSCLIFSTILTIVLNKIEMEDGSKEEFQVTWLLVTVIILILRISRIDLSFGIIGFVQAYILGLDTGADFVSVFGGCLIFVTLVSMIVRKLDVINNVPQTSLRKSGSLYQFYNQDKIRRELSKYDESDDDVSRNSFDLEKSGNDESAETDSISSRDQFCTKGIVHRALWSEMSEVKKCGILDKISSHEKNLQESMFEIITSEVTYIKSINVLIEVFVKSDELGSDVPQKSVLTREKRKEIFSNITMIQDASEKFLSDLEARWKKSVLLPDVCDIITKHATRNFDCYIHYCRNQEFQARKVKELKKNAKFAEALKKLESHPDCQGLPMISFLTLPMQRITRLRLLVDAICHRLDKIEDGKDELHEKRQKSAINALHTVGRVLKRCDDEARKLQQTEELCHLEEIIEFPNKEIRIPLISSNRFLVKQGDVIKVSNESSNPLNIGKTKTSKRTIYLFNDILLIAKKKGSKYIVTDRCERNVIYIELIEKPEKCARILPHGVPNNCKFLFLLTMLENHEEKQVETVYSCKSESDRTRWIEALTSSKDSGGEKIYENWDCPQVQCIKRYVAQEPDELTLEESDVVNVLKKLEDGMCEGERLRDGEKGWFPFDHTAEIENAHVRARNLKMQYRLANAASENDNSKS